MGSKLCNYLEVIKFLRSLTCYTNTFFGEAPFRCWFFYVSASLTTNLKSRAAFSKQSSGLTLMLGITWI